MKKKIIRRICIFLLMINFILPDTQPYALMTFAAALEKADDTLKLTCPSAILLEASTSTVIYEKNPDERRSPASITKIMTAIIIFDELEKGNIHLEDEVVTSAYAKSMGGSQVYLEEGEKQTVDTLIKCIMVSSGNDASVVMAEYIAGSEAGFVNMMNERAAALGMENTHFEDCCGLTDSDEHYTTARDVAIMARELIIKYPEITDYTTIWMENITHVTAQGSKEFGLANTNKLLKQYPYTTGLKTGSTDKAKYCVCATAKKDDLELIAVIMGCPNYKERFAEAQTLLVHGYGACRLYKDSSPLALNEVNVKGGVKETAETVYIEEFSYLSFKGEDFSKIERKLMMQEVTAPLEEGEKVGEVVYSLDGKELGKIGVYAGENVRKAVYTDYLIRLLRQWIDMGR